MPRKKQAKRRTQKETEQWFVDLYIKAGAQEHHIEKCEKRAHLEPGCGKKILRRKTVKAEIERRLALVQAEQYRQQVIVESTQKAKQSYQEELAKQVEVIKLHRLDPAIIEGRVMQGLICLDIKAFPKAVLEYAKTAAVLHGLMRAGNDQRITPPEPPARGNDGQWIYASIFDRPALNAAPAPPESPQAPSGEVFDLIPGRNQPEQSRAVDPLPAPGESIDEPPAKPKTDERVITVEVG